MAPRKVIRTLPDRAARRNPTPSSSLTVETPWPDEGSDIDPEYTPSDSDTSSSSGSEVDLETESELDDTDQEDEDELAEDEGIETTT